MAKLPSNYTCKKVKGKKLYMCHPKKTKKSKGKKKGRRKSHLGHRTKRGLAQDQKRKSKEKHEIAYRRSKRKK